MNKSIAIVVAVVVVLGAAYYLYPSFTNAPVVPTTETSEVAGTPMQEQMSGNWQSTIDAKFTREIRQGGVMIDRYEGDATAGINGEWSIVNPAEEGMLSSLAASLSGTTVVKVVWEGGAETTYFAVNSVTLNAMTITDLSGRGGVTVFTRI